MDTILPPKQKFHVYGFYINGYGMFLIEKFVTGLLKIRKFITGPRL